MKRSLSIITALLALSPLIACGDDFPPDPPKDFDDFGTEAYRMLRDELLWSGSAAEGRARAEIAEARRGDLIWAFGALISEPVSERILPVLDNFLPLYDPRADGSPGPLPQMTGDLSEIIGTLVADGPALEALAQIDAAPAANPDAIERLVGTLIRHPSPLADPLIDLTLDLEPQLTELFRWLHHELQDLDESAPLANDEENLLQRLLGVSIEGSDEPVGPLTLSARFDGRGAPVVRRRADGTLPAPFVDSDQDGLADINAAGRPIDAEGKAIAMPTFASLPGAGEERDRQGRAVVAGELVFDYFDLRRTALAYILRDGRELLADGVHFDLFTALEALLGGRVGRDDADGQYTGFYVEEAPLVDLLYGLNELRRYPRLVPLVRALEQMSLQKENLLRQLIVDLAEARQIFEAAPSLAPGNAFLEDLHPVLASMAKHGVVRALLAVSGESESQPLFSALATMMRFSGMALPSDMSALETPAQVDALQFTDPTPWGQPDTTDADRSWLQKAAYLLWDTRHAPVYLRLLDIVVVPEVQITDDMARLYVDAIADHAVIELGNPLLEESAVTLVREFDDLTPSAEQLNLFMNHNQPDTGNPICNQGLLVKDHHGPALLALQTSGNLDAMRPWVRRIYDLGRQEDFVNLFAVLAEHYSETPSVEHGFTSYGTGFRRWEPFITKVIDETDLGRHSLELGAWADKATFTEGGVTYNVADELDAFLTWALDVDAHVPLRDGSLTIPSKHGGVIAAPSRLQLVLYALDRVDEALSASPTAEAAWDRVDLLGLFLDLDDQGALINRHALDLTVALLPILADEAAQAVAQPDWSEGIDSLVGDLEDILGSRGFAALIDAMARVRDTPRHRAFVDRLTADLLRELPEREDTDLLGRALQALSTLGQLRVPSDALTRFLRLGGKLLDPAKRYAFRALESLRELRIKDPEGVMVALGLNLFIEPELGRFPYRIIKELFKEALRPRPEAVPTPRPYSAADLGAILGHLGDWLRDRDKGAERLYEVIRTR